MDFSGRKRRQTSSDFCEARFIVDGDTFVLVWACPEGGSPPGNEALVFLCEILLNNSIVTNCAYPDGTNTTESTPEPLPPIQ